MKDALAVQRKVTNGSGSGGGAASRAASIADGVGGSGSGSGSGSGPTVAVSASPLLQKCPFVLSGIHGDLAESGEVYLNLETLRLHLSLNVEDLMVALQQNTLAGGGMVSGRAPPPIFEEGDEDGASIGGGGDENDGEWLMRYANAAPAGRSPGPDDAASASSASIKQASAASSKKKTAAGSGVGGGASVESSVLSINDDSVDSFEDTTGSVRAALSAKSAAL